MRVVKIERSHCQLFLFLIIALFISSCTGPNKEANYDVVVLGAGTGGITAAIQSARSGAKTLYVNPLPWHGGMLTSAGVSATDGNHQLHAGLWAEWRALIRNHYGGADSIFTGWVSNTMFEPSVGAHYFDQLAANESLLEIKKNASWGTIVHSANKWKIEITSDNSHVTARILIDGTDLGDVAAQLGVPYDLGMDAREETLESVAPIESNNIVQDMTYAAILEEFPGKDMTIDLPEGYDARNYQCSCQTSCPEEGRHDCEKMLSYGKLPEGKYMVNWPFYGNDFYANVAEMNESERTAVYEDAKQHTLGFVYYIQQELGFPHLGLSDEFPTSDKLPLMPYHREGRRIKGLAQLKLQDIVSPYNSFLYRTGIAVGDYPIDHHHAKNPNAPEFDFPPVPSFSVPIGSLIPREVPNLLVADKAIAVSNIVNGSTRLQPVIMQTGQVAGLVAATSVQLNKSPKDVPIRLIQGELLQLNGYLLPYIDCSPEDEFFTAVQRIGATGLLRGQGVPYKWANQTWFYPDSLVNVDSLLSHIQSFDKQLAEFTITGDYLDVPSCERLLLEWSQKTGVDLESEIEIPGNRDRFITRAEFALILDKYIDPFHKKGVLHDGTWFDN